MSFVAKARTGLFAVLAFPIFVAAFPGIASANSICDSVPNNLIANCGFELGMLNSAPVDWAAHTGFLLNEGSFNQVVNSPVNSGNLALQFGNFDNDPAAGISQSFSDTLGDTVDVSFFMYDGGASS